MTIWPLDEWKHNSKNNWNFERYLNDALSVKNESWHQDSIHKNACILKLWVINYDWFLKLINYISKSHWFKFNDNNAQCAR